MFLFFFFNGVCVYIHEILAKNHHFTLHQHKFVATWAGETTESSLTQSPFPTKGLVRLVYSNELPFEERNRLDAMESGYSTMRTFH